MRGFLFYLAEARKSEGGLFIPNLDQPIGNQTGMAFPF